MNRVTAAILREWHRSDRLLYLLAFIVGLAFAIVSLELWAANLNVPLDYTGDAIAVGAHFKTVIGTGWYETQAMLGAPYGQTYNDFPTADNLHFMVMDVLGLFTTNWPLAMNFYFIIGFPLAAMAAVWLLRKLGISKLVSLVLGALYAIAPYHFFRSEGHLFLGSYFVVPFALGIVLMVIRGEAIWEFRATGPKLLRWATKRSIITIAILALTGTAQSYYSVFFLILLAFAGIVRLIASGNWKQFWGAAIAGLITVIAMLANMLPDMIYSWVNGDNPSGFSRGHAEAEIYALKLAQLLLPWPGSRIPILAKIREAYDAHYPLLSEDPALGAVAAFGFVALFLILAWAIGAWGTRRGTRITSSPQFILLAQLASLLFVMFIFATVGGLSTIISFVTSSIRGWNRIAIIMSMVCLIAVGVLMDAAIRWLQLRAKTLPVKRLIAFGLAGIVLVGGYIDQTPADPSANYAATAAKFQGDDKWIKQIEASVPAGSMILQLPYQPFPETVGPTGILGTETLIPFLHSQTLRWSGGGIKGRPRADWPGMVGQLSPEDIMRFTAAAGFVGIYIDRASLTPNDDAELEQGLAAGDTTKMTSGDGRYVFYNVEKVRTNLGSEFSNNQLADFAKLIVDPVTVTIEPSFVTGISPSGTLQHPAVSLTPSLLFTNERKDTPTVNFTIAMHSDDRRSTSVKLTLPGGQTQTVPLVGGSGKVTVSFPVAPGVSPLGFEVEGSAADLTASLVLDHYESVETGLVPLQAR